MKLGPLVGRGTVEVESTEKKEGWLDDAEIKCFCTPPKRNVPSPLASSHAPIHRPT